MYSRCISVAFHQCKVQCTLFEQFNNKTSWCEHFSACAWTPKVERSVCQAPSKVNCQIRTGWLHWNGGGGGGGPKW